MVREVRYFVTFPGTQRAKYDISWRFPGHSAPQKSDLRQSSPAWMCGRVTSRYCTTPWLQHISSAHTSSLPAWKAQGYGTVVPITVGERIVNVHKLSPIATKNADRCRAMKRPVKNWTMRSNYNSKQQENTPPSLGGSPILEIKKGEALRNRIVQNRMPVSNSTPESSCMTWL